MLGETLVAALPLAVSDDPGMWTTLLSQIWLWTRVAIGIGLVIFVHELGHFAAAKLFGVKCEKFYVGFDVPLRIGPIKFPRTLGRFQFGETEYGIGILPLGGYVKMLGQDDDPRKAAEEAERIRVSEGDDHVPAQLDPRSYPAKPVWQRMVIISAGVIMNVVTGILFAAIAYGVGVPYTPAIVGGVTAGGPAWQAGVQPGGQVVAVGALSNDDELHFNEMRLRIVQAGMDQPDDPVDVSLQYNGEVRSYQLKTRPHPVEPDIPMIGITSGSSAELSKERPAMPESAAAKVLDDEDAGATIVSFNDTPIDHDALVPPAPLLDQIHSHPDRPIRLVLRPAEDGEHEVELPPQPVKSLGVTFQIGPITALVNDGPAEAAGVQVGDVITAIDGNKEIDAYALAFDPITGTEPVRLTLRRGDGDDAETIQVEVTPADVRRTLPPVSELGDEIASTSLGLAYRPLTTIAAAPTAGEATAGDTTAPRSADSAESAAQLRPGDRLREASIRWPDGEPPEFLTKMFPEEAIKSLTKGWEFGSQRPLVRFVETLQLLPPGTKVRVIATRPPEGTVIESELEIRTSDRYWYERGLILAPRTATQTADSLARSVALGWREGKRRLGDVFQFLGMLVEGKVKPKYVGGPVRIVQMAGMQAEKGISKQLLFLTLLSMNLAILNFLPIPALDGGHMVFLTYELVRGKKVDEQLEMKLTLAGVLALLALMVFVFANDLLHI